MLKAIKRTLVLSVTLASLGMSAHIFATSAEDYEKALKAYNKAEYDETYIHLKNSLQKDPSNLASKILMGEILLINGYLVAAEVEFTEALDMGADINLLAEPLGNTWLFLNKYRNIVDFAQTDKLTNEAKQEWLLIKAAACSRLKRIDCAKQSYQQVRDINTKEIQATNGLASLAIQEEQLDRASRYIETSLSIDPTNAIAWRLKGQLAFQQGNKALATEHLQKALSFNKDDPIALRNLVDLYMQSQDYDSAKLLVDEIIEDTPNDPLAILLSSWLQSREQDELIKNEQLQRLNDFMAELSPELIASQPMLLYISGLTNFFNGNLEKASNDFRNYLVEEPDDLKAVMLLSQTYTATQQDKKALALLEKHQEQLLDDLDSALILGDLLIKQNRAFKAEKLVQELERRNPKSSKLQLFNIKLMAARGRQEQALSILDSNYEDYKSEPAFVFTYAVLKLQAEQFEDALNATEQLNQLLPENAEIYNLKAGVLIRQGLLAEAKTAILEALSINPILYPAKFNLAAIESRMGNIDASSVIVEELLSLSPKHTETLLLKAFNHLQRAEQDSALVIYNDVLTLNPQNTAAREKLVEIYQNQNELDQALYHVERLIKDEFDNPKFLLTKASIQLRLGQRSEAEKTLAIASHFVKQDVQSLVSYSDLMLALGKVNEALASLSEAEQKAPNNTRLTMQRIRLEIQSDMLDEASSSLQKVASKNQQNPNYWLLRGMLALKKSAPDNAKDYYLKALTLDENFGQPLLGLYNFALQEKYVDVFLSEAERISEKHPQNLLAKNLLAQYLFFIREYDKSIPLYLELASAPQILNKAEVLNRLAQMHIESDINKAADYANQAYAIDGNDPLILDTMGWVKSKQGDLVGALENMRDAYARDARNPNIRYHLGAILLELGRIEEAKDELEYAVNVDRPFFNRPKAQALLDKITSS